MSAGGKWIVEIHNDEVNTYAGVALIAHRLLGLPQDQGYELAADLHHSESVELTPRPGPEAERLVADLQVFGLHATLREA
ncbi:ATP-dependent Clp protease adaptor ClpS [Amycolatopsis samaneae]|uniref:ATP-dependent Clp protease adaptor ClpS n=1 Tax=Amycolatopsis samaneae TaxID=664691 RepID=A0ABW5GM72_9PSEU